MDQVFSGLETGAGRGFDRQPQVLHHLLDTSKLFDDDALVRLIETTPRDRYHINTTGYDASGLAPRWREGDMMGLSGRDVLEAVGKGKVWVHLQRVQEADPAYRRILERAFAELEAHIPGFRTYKRSMSVLVSSPKMEVAYHADVPGQSLWQVRGRKRVWVYPAQDPFLPRASLEKIVLKRSNDTDLAYHPRFDQSAQVIDLTPGDMVTWPHNWPHRVVNEDCVNVSVTMEHWTDDLRAAYAVTYANGLLRPIFGEGKLATTGPAFHLKYALAGAHKLMARVRQHALPLVIDFRVDPRSQTGLSDIAPYQLQK